MKLNRKRKDARFPNWVLDLLANLQIKYQWTFTEALIRCTEKGAAYYYKQWQKMHPSEKGSEEPRDDERYPNDRQDDYKPKKTKKESWKDDPNWQDFIEKYKEAYGKEPETEQELNDFARDYLDKHQKELYGIPYKKDKKANTG